MQVQIDQFPSTHEDEVKRPDAADVVQADTVRFATIAEAAKVLGLKYHHLQRAAAAELFRSYRPFGRRRYVLIPEIVTFILNSQQGGVR